MAAEALSLHHYRFDASFEAKLPDALDVCKEWQQGNKAALPLSVSGLEAVLCQDRSGSGYVKWSLWAEDHDLSGIQASFTPTSTELDLHLATGHGHYPDHRHPAVLSVEGGNITLSGDFESPQGKRTDGQDTLRHYLETGLVVATNGLRLFGPLIVNGSRSQNLRVDGELTGYEREDITILRAPVNEQLPLTFAN